MRRVSLLLLLLAPEAFALDASRAISQYGHTMWTLQEGLLPGTPTVMAQTTDGYLWIGTRSGLVRFDGVRFVPFSPPRGEALRSTRILSLFGSRDGSLWIGTRMGLERWYHGHLTYIEDAPGWVMTVLEDRTGKIWFTRMSIKDGKGPVCEVVQDRARCHGAAEGVPITYARDALLDAHGDLWTLSDTTLIRWKAGASRTWRPPGITPAEEATMQDVLQSMAMGSDGTLWVGAIQPTRGLGLLRFEGDELRSVITPELDGRKLSVSGMLMDRHDALWIATQDEGIYRLKSGRASHFRKSDGLSGDTAQTLFEDREGTLWVLTTQGVDAFRDLRVSSITSREGLSADLANGVLAAHDGTVWIDNWHSLEAWRDGKLSVLNARNGLPGEEVTALFEDRDGTLWVGLDLGLTVYEHGKFAPVRREDGKPVGYLQAMTQDANGDLWVVTSSLPATLYRIHQRRIVAEFSREKIPFTYGAIVADPRDGIWLPLKNGDLGHFRDGQLQVFEFHREGAPAAIASMVGFPDGSVVGATALGLVAVRAGHTQIMTAENGLPCTEIHSLLKDLHGALWLYASCGVIHIAADQVQSWWTNPRAVLKFEVLDALDGVQPARGNFFPKASTGPDGRLWFANASVVQMIDPDHLAKNPVVPPVQIEQLLADHVSFGLDGVARLPPNSRDLQIDYTGLSLVVPRKTHFRYRLLGHESEWQDVGTRRQAFYTDLPPRDYVFQVTASNNDGVWNPQAARLAFSIAPTFYQTRTFTALCVVCLLGAMWLMFLFRVRQLEARMRLRLEERERIARDLHDTLLQGLLSASLQLSVANDVIPPEAPAKSLIERIMQLLRQAIDEGRRAVGDLRTRHPVPDALEKALAQIPHDLSMDESVQFRLLAEGSPRVLRAEVHDEVYRICREALANAFRHSGAAHVEIAIEYSRHRFRVVVRDDGCGMDPSVVQSGRSGHWGLSGMRERALRIGGELNVMSATGAGTEVNLTVPGGAAYGGAAMNRWTGWLRRSAH